MKIGAIIQARTSSSRLPNKVLKQLPFGGKLVVLEHVIRRVVRSSQIDQVIVATTQTAEDDEIVRISRRAEVACFRGSKNHVLSRYYEAAKKARLDIVVRISSDCPCIDWEIIDRVVMTLCHGAYDFVHTAQSYPRGVGDVEAMTFDALEKAYKGATKKCEIEHVTPYIYKTHPRFFRLISLNAPKSLRFPDIRVTLDTAEDYALLCSVFDFLYFGNQDFTTRDVVSLFQKRPWLKLINVRSVQKKNTDLKGEIAETLRLLKMQDLYQARNFLRRQWKQWKR